MAELQLQRTARRTYAVDGIGSLRFDGVFSRAATAQAGGLTLRFARPRLWARTIEATGATGQGVGSFEPRTFRRGGALRWGGRDLSLRAASAWRERYALADGDTELAVLDGKGWGRKPVKISIDDPAAVDPGLLLFAAFVVRGLAEDASSVAGATASTAATSG